MMFACHKVEGVTETDAPVYGGMEYACTLYNEDGKTIGEPTNFFIGEFLYGLIKALIDEKNQIQTVANIQIQTLQDLIKQLNQK